MPDATEPSPYEVAPVPTNEQLAAALAVIKSAGISVADATAAHDQTMAALRSARDPAPRCHRCGAPATAQWQQHATAEQAETWHAGREQWIRQHNDGRAEAGYVADRSDPVTVAVHGCGEHPDPCPGRVHDADCGGHGACGCGGAE